MSNVIHKYINVMEELVEIEVNKQLKNLPPMFLKYRDCLNPVEIQTYALNHLPCLYASSTAGKFYQLEKGKTQLSEQIQTTVTRAIASVLRDPIRQSEPLLESINPDCISSVEQEKLEQLEKAVIHLQAYLQEHNLIEDDDEIRADNLLKIIRNSLREVTRPVDQVLLELQEYLFQKQLIGINCQIHLGNLVEVIRLVLKQRITHHAAKIASQQALEKMSDLEYYLSMKDELEQEQETEYGNNFISEFGQLIRDNYSGQVMGDEKASLKRRR
ncbi:late competence development ComFB family protein [Gloeothece verrucosa]|uniref:Late competence development protein ComFB n=1 Tax=Gloeothece verrucosa (strain PCC 7822) TaxID=497965 RepID=E0U686_GLOV7|nr:late competence development ComFB family protein [Gloeothece verrucosa]ADN12422.1 Late competence development protein ComFB [Gloeothece verrucosa PCC 7822]